MGKKKLVARWQKAAIAAAAALALTAGFVPLAQAQSVFAWVCDDSTCNGDPGFSFTITFAAGVAAPNATFTGVDGNVTAATLTSGVGDGFTLTLADLIETGTTTNDRSNFQVTFDSSGTQVKDLLDVSEGTNLTFFDDAVARLDILEGTDFNYFIQFREDRSPEIFSDVTPVTGRLVLVDTSVKVCAPENQPTKAQCDAVRGATGEIEPSYIVGYAEETGEPVVCPCEGTNVKISVRNCTMNESDENQENICSAPGTVGLEESPQAQSTVAGSHCFLHTYTMDGITIKEKICPSH